MNLEDQITCFYGNTAIYVTLKRANTSASGTFTLVVKTLKKGRKIMKNSHKEDYILLMYNLSLHT